VFHISLLEPYHPNTIPNRIVPPPPPIEIAGNDEYEVESVLDIRVYYRKFQYLVKWIGYDDPEWNYYSDMGNALDVIYDFHRKYPSRIRPPDIIVPPLHEEA
jgi:hypothetical protein